MSPRSTSPDFLPERNHPDKTHLRMRLMPAVVQQYRRMQASVSRRPVQIQSGASQARGQANGQAIDSRAARYPDVRCEATAQLIRARERMLLNGDKMEPVAARRIVAPQRPGADKVQAQAEPRLDNRKHAPGAPAFRQTVTVQEDMARLPKTTRCAMVYIAKLQ